MIGVYEQRWGAPVGPLCVYLHGVRDPGNVGTVLRSAAGLRRLLRRARARLRRSALAEGGAREHGRDLRRARSRAWATCERAAGRRGSRSSRGGAGRRCGEALGDGAAGRSRCSSAPSARACRTALVAACDAHARIPIATESLNAAMAATVALYETTR